MMSTPYRKPILIATVAACAVAVAVKLLCFSAEREVPEPLPLAVSELVFADLPSVPHDTANIRVAGAARVDKRGKVVWQVPGEALFLIIDPLAKAEKYTPEFSAEVCTYNDGNRILLGGGNPTCEWGELGLTARCKIHIAARFEIRGKLGVIIRGTLQGSSERVEIGEYVFSAKLEDGR